MWMYVYACMLILCDVYMCVVCFVNVYDNAMHMGIMWYVCVHVYACMSVSMCVYTSKVLTQNTKTHHLAISIDRISCH